MTVSFAQKISRMDAILLMDSFILHTIYDSKDLMIADFFGLTVPLKSSFCMVLTCTFTHTMEVPSLFAVFYFLLFRSFFSYMMHAIMSYTFWLWFSMFLFFFTVLFRIYFCYGCYLSVIMQTICKQTKKRNIVIQFRVEPPFRTLKQSMPVST